MVRISNFIVGFLNFCTLLLGLGAIALSLFLRFQGETQCEKVLQTPLLVTGIFLFVVSLLGFIGACCKSNLFLMIYLFVMFLLMIGLMVYMVFAFMVTNEGFGNVFSNRGFGDYKTYNFSGWIKNRFMNDHKSWIEIRSCLRDSKVCSSLANGADHKTNQNLGPIQNGCCKPPSECGFEQQNKTFWTPAKSGPAVDNSDCKTWNNDQQQLCYDCNTCKDGVVSTIKKDWRNMTIFNLCALVLVIFTYMAGCCAKRNNRKDNKKLRRQQPA